MCVSIFDIHSARISQVDCSKNDSIPPPFLIQHASASPDQYFSPCLRSRSRSGSRAPPAGGGTGHDRTGQRLGFLLLWFLPYLMYLPTALLSPFKPPTSAPQPLCAKANSAQARGRRSSVGGRKGESGVGYRQTEKKIWGGGFFENRKAESSAPVPNGKSNFPGF